MNISNETERSFPLSNTKKFLNGVTTLSDLEDFHKQLIESISQVDPVLLFEINTKISKSQELLSLADGILSQGSEDLFLIDLDYSNDIISQANKLKVTFPEIGALETAVILKKSLREINTMIKNERPPIKKKIADGQESDDFEEEDEDINEDTDGLREDSEENGEEVVRSISERLERMDSANEISNRLSLKLKPLLPSFKKIGDLYLKNKSQTKLIKSLSAMVWIKEAYEILNKEAISLGEINQIINTEPDELGFYEKFENIKTEYRKLHKKQKEWQAQIKEFEDSGEIQQCEELLKIKNGEALVNSFSNKISELLFEYDDLKKISDLEPIKNKAQSYFDWLEWALNFHRRDDINSLNLADIEVLIQEIEAKKIPNEWESVKLLQSKYKKTKLLLEKARAFTDIYSQNSSSMPIEETPKIKFEEINDIFIALQNNDIKLERETERLGNILKESRDFSEEFTEFKAKYSRYLSFNFIFDEAPNLAIYKEIEELLISLRSKADNQRLSASKVRESIRYWFWALQMSIILVNSEKKAHSIWKKLAEESETLASIIEEVDQDGAQEDFRLLKSIIERELGNFDKIRDFITEMRASERWGADKKRKHPNKFKNSSEMDPISLLIRVCKIEIVSSDHKYIGDFIEKLENIQKQLQGFSNCEKKTLIDCENLLEAMKKIPLIIQDEDSLEDEINKARALHNKVKLILQKPNDEAEKTLLEEYNNQRIFLVEFEKLVQKRILTQKRVDEVKMKTCQLADMDFGELCKLNEEIDEINDEGNDMQLVKIGIFNKKIAILRVAWNAGEPVMISYHGLKSLQNEGKELVEKSKIDQKTDEFTASNSLIESLIYQVDERVGVIRRMSDLKSFSDLEKETPSFKCVDLTEILIDHRTRIEYSLNMRKAKNEPPATINNFSQPQKPIIPSKTSTKPPPSASNQGTKKPLIQILDDKNKSNHYNNIKNTEKPTEKAHPEAALKKNNAGSNTGGKNMQEKKEFSLEFLKNIQIIDISSRKKLIEYFTKILSSNLKFVDDYLGVIELEEIAMRIVDFIIEDKLANAFKNAKEYQDVINKASRYPNLIRKFIAEGPMIEVIEKLKSKPDTFLESKERQALMIIIGGKDLDAGLHSRDLIKKKVKLETGKTSNYHQCKEVNSKTNETKEKKRHLLDITLMKQAAQLSKSFVEDSATAEARSKALTKQKERLLQERQLLHEFRTGRKNKSHDKDIIKALTPDRLSLLLSDAENKQFSEEDEVEYMFKDIKPLKENEVEEFQKFKEMKSVREKAILYDPDGEGFTDEEGDENNKNADNLKRKKKNKNEEKYDFKLKNIYFPEASKTDYLEKVDISISNKTLRIFEGRIKKLFHKSRLVLVNLFTNTDIKRASLLPRPVEMKLKISARIEREKFERFFEKVLKHYSKDNYSREIVISGWIEPVLLSDSESLEQSASEMDRNDQVGVINWSEQCMLYIMNKEVISLSWRNKLGLVQSPINSLKANSSLFFVIVYKSYKVTDPNIKKIVPFVINKFEPQPIEPQPIDQILSKDLKPKNSKIKDRKDLNKVIDQNESRLSEPKYVRMLPKPSIKKLKPKNLLEKMRSNDKYYQEVSEFSKRVGMYQKNGFQRDEKPFLDVSNDGKRTPRGLRSVGKSSAGKKSALKFEKKSVKKEDELNSSKNNNKDLMQFINNFRFNIKNKSESSGRGSSNLKISDIKEEAPSLYNSKYTEGKENIEQQYMEQNYDDGDGLMDFEPEIPCNPVTKEDMEMNPIFKIEDERDNRREKENIKVQESFKETFLINKDTNLNRSEKKIEKKPSTVKSLKKEKKGYKSRAENELNANKNFTAKPISKVNLQIEKGKKTPCFINDNQNKSFGDPIAPDSPEIYKHMEHENVDLSHTFESIKKLTGNREFQDLFGNLNQAVINEIKDPKTPQKHKNEDDDAKNLLQLLERSFDSLKWPKKNQIEKIDFEYDQNISIAIKSEDESNKKNFGNLLNIKELSVESGEQANALPNLNAKLKKELETKQSAEIHAEGHGDNSQITLSGLLLKINDTLNHMLKMQTLSNANAQQQPNMHHMMPNQAAVQYPGNPYQSMVDQIKPTKLFNFANTPTPSVATPFDQGKSFQQNIQNRTKFSPFPRPNQRHGVEYEENRNRPFFQAQKFQERGSLIPPNMNRDDKKDQMPRTLIRREEHSSSTMQTTKIEEGNRSLVRSKSFNPHSHQDEESKQQILNYRSQIEASSNNSISIRANPSMDINRSKNEPNDSLELYKLNKRQQPNSLEGGKNPNFIDRKPKIAMEAKDSNPSFPNHKPVQGGFPARNFDFGERGRNSDLGFKGQNKNDYNYERGNEPGQRPNGRLMNAVYPNNKNILPEMERFTGVQKSQSLMNYKVNGQILPRENLREAKENFINTDYHHINKKPAQGLGSVKVGNPLSDSFSEDKIKKKITVKIEPPTKTIPVKNIPNTFQSEFEKGKSSKDGYKNNQAAYGNQHRERAFPDQVLKPNNSFVPANFQGANLNNKGRQNQFTAQVKNWSIGSKKG